MPVYKYTEKRLQKKQRREEDAEALERALKQLEEASSSGEAPSIDESQESDNSDGSESDLESIGTMDSEDDSSDDGEEEGSGEEDEDEDDAEGADEESEVDEEDDFDISIEEVTSKPTYQLPAPHPSGSSACIVCPTRIFKNDHMVTEHLSSKGHKRSMKRWETFLEKAKKEGIELEGDPRIIMEEIMDDLEATREGGEAAVEPAEGATPAKSNKKRRRKADRKEEQAKKLVEAAKASGASKSIGGKKGEEKGQDGVKLNRKARRMAAREGIKV